GARLPVRPLRSRGPSAAPRDGEARAGGGSRALGRHAGRALDGCGAEAAAGDPRRPSARSRSQRPIGSPGPSRRAVMIEKLRTFLRDFRSLAAPYWSSEERWRARALLVVVVSLSLGQVYLLVSVNTSV